MGFNKKFFTTGGIVASSAAAAITGTDHFSPVTYTGNGSTQSISSLDFQPDFVWIKSRDNAAFEHAIFDSVRGAGTSKVLSSSTTNAEGFTIAAPMTSFDSNGFTVEPRSDGKVNNLVNKSGEDLVAWCWKAAGAANTYNVLENGTVTSDSTASGAGITAGTITTGWEVSANRDAGFSIVSYTGDGSGNNTSTTVGHGLSSAPELVIAKILDTSGSWQIQYAKDSDNLAGSFSSAAFINHSAVVPTSTVFNPYYANSSNNFITYCFHSVDEYQKIGSYSGNSTSGRLIDTGFQPRFVLIKTTNATSNWFILDSVRGGTQDLRPNGSNAEETRTNGVTFVSNGFEIDDTSVGFNSTGTNYIYLAIA